MSQDKPISVNTRTIEMAVNACVSQFEMLGLTAVEGILSAGHLIEFLETKFQVTYADLTKDFRPDKKLDLPNLRQ